MFTDSGYLGSTSLAHSKIVYDLFESAEMTTQETPERLQVDKDVVKEALREILNEIPSFHTMVQPAVETTPHREKTVHTLTPQTALWHKMVNRVRRD